MNNVLKPLLPKRSKKSRKNQKAGRSEYDYIHSKGRDLVIYKSPGTQIFPDIYACTLKYRERVVLTSSVGVPSIYQFSANSCYDPNITSTGTNPEGWQELSGMYTNYRVVNSRISVQFMNTATTNATSDGEMALSVQPNLTLPSTLEAIASAPYSKRAIRSLINNPPLTLSIGVPIHKVVGVNAEAVLDADKFSGLTGAVGTGSNPVQNCAFSIGFQALDRSSTVAAITYVEIFYDVEFYNRLTYQTQF